MEPLFSEFSYGYAVTEEFSSGKFGQIKGTPAFPSLHTEGKQGGGYDVNIPIIGVPLFLQFKLSHYLSRANSLEWNQYGKPYYRVYLRPLKYSQQHKLLLDLEKSGNDVYYIAPRFHRVSDLDNYYGSNMVVAQSALIRPENIGILPDAEEHYITFLANDSIGFLWSHDPNNFIKFTSTSQFEHYQIFRLEEHGRKINIQFFDDMANRIIEVLESPYGISKEMSRLRRQLQMRETIEAKAQFVSYLARANLDAEFLIIRRQE